MKRITIAALGLVVGSTAGCVDMGLGGNVPLEEAEDRPPTELVAAVHRPTEAVSERIIVDGRLWVPSGMPLTAEASDLQAVGSADGRTVYARRWDRAPYDALLMQLPDGTTAATPVALLNRAGWIELRPVLGRSGPVPGTGAGEAAATEPAAPAHGTDDGGH